MICQRANLHLVYYKLLWVIRMAPFWRKVASLFSVFPLTLSGTASADVAAELAWTKANQRNTVESYTEFVIEYPNSEHAEIACKRLATAALPDSLVTNSDVLKQNEEADLSDVNLTTRFIMVV